jgi:hypothetical protein
VHLVRLVVLVSVPQVVVQEMPEVTHRSTPPRSSNFLTKPLAAVAVAPMPLVV